MVLLCSGFSWDALLKHSGVELDVLQDLTMLLFFEEATRGGISSINHRYSKANHKYLPDFSPKEKSKFIVYLDANALYSESMLHPLPVGDFSWMTENELKNWKDIPCVLEVDLRYPPEIHEIHNQFPLAPEILNLGDRSKLVPNLMNKEKYILHKLMLLLYLSLGMKLQKIHRGVRFKEVAWMKSYIEKNMILRAKAKYKVEEDFYKLLSNSVYGKTLENIRKRKDIRFVNSREKAAKLATLLNFTHCTIFSEDLTAFHMRKTTILSDKPIYTGMCILDFSKCLMFNFFYGYMMKKWKKVSFNDRHRFYPDGNWYRRLLLGHQRRCGELF